MSKISTAYDGALARLRTLFASADGWHELTNPYSIGDNSSAVRKQGFGLAVGGPASNANLVQNCWMSQVRPVTVVLAQEVLATENDVDAKHEAWKSLLENAYKVVKDFHQDSAVDGNVSNLVFQGDSGIQLYNPTGEERTYFIELVFNLTYLDNLGG